MFARNFEEIIAPPVFGSPVQSLGAREHSDEITAARVRDAAPTHLPKSATCQNSKIRDPGLWVDGYFMRYRNLAASRQLS
jgi:hypothetical protein